MTKERKKLLTSLLKEYKQEKSQLNESKWETASLNTNVFGITFSDVNIKADALDEFKKLGIKAKTSPGSMTIEIQIQSAIEALMIKILGKK